MDRLHVRAVDPIFVEPKLDAKKVELRIGEARPGETRTAYLTASETRTLAYRLLSAAEDLDAADAPT